MGYAKLRAGLIARDGAWCRLCCRALNYDPVDFTVVNKDRLGATIDHIIPCVYGGTDSFTNLQLACRECNGKRNHSIDYNTVEALLYAHVATLQHMGKPSRSKNVRVLLHACSSVVHQDPDFPLHRSISKLMGHIDLATKPSPKSIARLKRQLRELVVFQTLYYTQDEWLQRFKDAGVL